jgi:hypothetical protein
MTDSPTDDTGRTASEKIPIGARDLANLVSAANASPMVTGRPIGEVTQSAIQHAEGALAAGSEVNNVMVDWTVLRDLVVAARPAREVTETAVTADEVASMATAEKALRKHGHSID